MMSAENRNLVDFAERLHDLMEEYGISASEAESMLHRVSREDAHQRIIAECEENPFACYSARIGAGVISTASLGMAFEPEEKYENPDGSPLVLDTDILGKKRQGRVIPGPFAVL